MNKGDFLIANNELYIIYDRKLAIKPTFFTVKIYSIEELLSYKDIKAYTLDLKLTWPKRKSINQLLSDLIVYKNISLNNRLNFINFINNKYKDIFGIELIEYPKECNIKNLLQSKIIKEVKIEIE